MEGFSSGDQYIPTQVNFNGGNEENHEVIDISAGKGHAGALIRRRSAVSEYENVSYMWGANKHGQLGLGDYETRKTPCEVIIKYGPGNNESSDTLTVSVKDQ